MPIEAAFAQPRVQGSQIRYACALALGLAPLVQADEAGGGLQEVVVTATRQEDTVNRVPLSIQAVTQAQLDEKGINNSADLVRAVPGLSTLQNFGGAQQTFSIRGIVGGVGAATTSVYLDDTNLTKRSNAGAAQNNGVVTPLLYDLDRVEVLKGPQGTLYGGSSEGGTIRFITPKPRLDAFTGTVRAELSSYGKGEPSSELAGAFGGPIVNDRLGFRVSAIARDTGGWVNVVSAYDNHLIQKDANGETDWAARASLLWRVTDTFDALLSGYHVDNWLAGGPSSQTLLYMPDRSLAPAGQTFTTQTRCITNQTRTAPLAQPGGAAGAIFIPASVAPLANGACPTGTLFVRQGITYGPFGTGADISLATNRQKVIPQTSNSDVVAMSLEWNPGATWNLKSVTSYLGDHALSNAVGGEEWVSTTAGAGQRTTLDVTHAGFPLFAPLLSIAGDGNTGYFLGTNRRHGIEQEFRVSRGAGDSRLSWVAGAFFSKTQTAIQYQYLTNNAVQDAALAAMYGVFGGPNGQTSESTARYGTPNDQGIQAYLHADIEDKESAVFGEGNLWLVPDKLKLIAGLRYSELRLNYYQLNYGPFSGRMPTSIGSVTSGNSKNTPVTPKGELEYEWSDNKRVYASATKGFRAGGVSAQISQSTCQVALDNLGITAAEIPPAFGPDTVWSYELGGKFKFFDKLQINLAAFRIDWKDIQVTTTLSCAQAFTSNGGGARSEGGELSVEYQPVNSLYLYLNSSYINARYIDPVTGPVGANAKAVPLPSLNAGDKFNVPPFTVSTGAQLTIPIKEVSAYARLDGTYQNAYTQGATPGTSGFTTNFFTRGVPSRLLVNARVGARWDNGFELNLFVQNLLGSHKQLLGFSGGRSCVGASVASTDCSTYGAYTPFVEQVYETPRNIGLQANYRF